MFRKIKLELTEDWLVPHSVGRCCAVLWGETPSMALPRDDSWMPRYWPAWEGIVCCCNSSVKVTGPTNQFLIWFEAYSTRGNSCLVWQTWPRAHGSGGHRPDGTACHCFTELTCCQAALWPTHLYPLICACLNLPSIAVMGQWPKVTWK